MHIIYSVVLIFFLVGEFMERELGARKSIYRETVDGLDLSGCEVTRELPLDFSEAEMKAEFLKDDRKIIIKFCRTDDGRMYGVDVLPPYIIKVIAVDIIQ